MKTLLKNGKVVNVFTDEIENTSVLIENGKIIGVGDYSESDADITEDVGGKYICPGFIDGHIHIESTMLTPAELAKVCVAHGTTAIVADPHEIANVCGVNGIKYMIEMSRNIPLNVYFMLPSCVPATQFDESGAVLKAADLEPLYDNDRVLGLAEMMNFPGVLAEDADVLAKIKGAYSHNRTVDGHAPMLCGKALDKYITAGIKSDHECSSYDEAKERIRKGQWLMIRQGTAARNLKELLPLFDESGSHRCLLVTDDRHPADLLHDGHIDNIIRLAVNAGKSAVTAVRMATIQAAECFGLKNVGAVAPGYKADILVLNDLNSVDVNDVYSSGKKIVADKKMMRFDSPSASKELELAVRNSFNVDKLSAADFFIEPKSKKCRVIKLVPNQLLTDEVITEINWQENNGISTSDDILKLAVIERHKHTGHRGLGFISGIGLKNGAIASSVSHDSHNIIVIGTNDEDMAAAANRICEIGGGCVAVDGGKVLAEMPLPIGGLMSDGDAETVADENANLRETVYSKMGVSRSLEPFMTMAFVSLSVIPSLKMTTNGLVDVNNQSPVSLYAD